MRQALCAVVTCAALVLLAAPAQGEGQVLKGPYLQELTSTSVALRVELSAPAPVSAEVHASGGKPITVTSPALRFHSVVVKGLTPGTRYDFSVHVGATSTRGGSFVTAPPDGSHDPITFLAYGDNRTDGPSHERVVRAMMNEKSDFLVHTGDFVIAGGEDEAWQTFFDIEGQLLASHCLFACVGNHELASDREAVHFERYFGPTQEPGAPESEPSRLYRTVRWGRVRFFLLNAFQDWTTGGERAWLEKELTHADQEADLGWRIVLIHHSPYSAGPHGDNTVVLRAHVDELLRAHHVDLVIAGHDHIYERGEERGLRYVITGGGGAPLYRELTPGKSTRKVEATFNYVVTTVTEETLSIVAKRPDGTLVDACSTKHEGSWLCDPPKPSVGPAPPTPSAEPKEKPRAGCGCGAAGAGSTGGGEGMAGLLLAGLLRRCSHGGRAVEENRGRARAGGRGRPRGPRGVREQDRAGRARL
jgi:predicted phosphodiesterase